MGENTGKYNPLLWGELKAGRVQRKQGGVMVPSRRLKILKDQRIQVGETPEGGC